MGTIRVHEFISLDGVIDAPTWTFGFGYDPAMGQAIGNLMSSCSAILLGRTTFEMFEPAWSARTADEDPGAPFMNETTKYVVSSTLTETTWQNSEIVGPYRADAIRKLKDDVDGGIYVSGSATLVHSLIADGLLDELHLFVYPLSRGAGPRLFPDDVPTTWSLARSETYGNGVLHLVYTSASAAPVS
ncbi:MAG TPA: dihydrofolate reductase family protein [Jatrophihabitantaceae bacterium]|jgi:dihydrofolate reductase|nr:dihydrofolate reductase family protein [Jatrophihabitantaceae bacterium]